MVHHEGRTRLFFCQAEQSRAFLCSAKPVNENHPLRPRHPSCTDHIYNSCMPDPPLFRNRFRIPSARMPGRDYGVGWYFVTICTHGRAEWFGDVCDQTLYLSDIGWVVNDEWQRTATLRPYVNLGEYVIMPNHIHAIISIGEYDDERDTDVETPRRGVSTKQRTKHWQPGCLGAIINQFKRACTVRIRAMGHVDFQWQPRFHDRIIRDLDEGNRIREYIWLNPMKWPRDRNVGG